MSWHDYPITLCVDEGEIEGLPATWVECEADGPLRLVSVRLGGVTFGREQFRAIVGTPELERQEGLADRHHAETADDRRYVDRLYEALMREAAE